MIDSNHHFLYKYYDLEGLTATLENSARLWSYPQGLLEPMECRTGIKWEYGGLQEIVVACVRKQDDAPGSKSLNIDYQRFLDKMTDGSLVPERFVNDLIDAFNEELRQLQPYCLTCCFTKNGNCLPMWRHYADNHQGGIIRFGNQEKTNSPLINAQKVHYHTEHPRARLAQAIEDTDNSYLLDVLPRLFLAKNPDWKYEEEWRVVSLETPTEPPEAIAPDAEQLALGRKLIPFAKEEVTAVYWGLNMPAAERQKLTELVIERYPWAEIYQARCQRKSLGLEYDCLKSKQYELPFGKI